MDGILSHSFFVGLYTSTSAESSLRRVGRQGSEREGSAPGAKHGRGGSFKPIAFGATRQPSGQWDPIPDFSPHAYLQPGFQSQNPALLPKLKDPTLKVLSPSPTTQPPSLRPHWLQTQNLPGSFPPISYSSFQLGLGPWAGQPCKADWTGPAPPTITHCHVPQTHPPPLPVPPLSAPQSHPVHCCVLGARQGNSGYRKEGALTWLSPWGRPRLPGWVPATTGPKAQP